MYLSREEVFFNIMDVIDRLEENISNIKNIEFVKKNKTTQIIKYIEDEIYKTRSSLEELKSPFLLFIVGLGNYGKSTLINALLKDKIIQTSDLPNTWKIDLFINSEREKIEINYNNNDKKILNIEEGKIFLKTEEDKFKSSKKEISAILNKNKKKYSDIKQLKRYKQNLEEKYLYKSNIVQVKYFIKNKEILSDFIIVDTPGLNQNLVEDTMNRMKEYYRRSDGVLWVIDGQNIVSKSNEEIVNEISEIEALYNNKNMIAVINKIDVINQDNNISKVENMVKNIYKNKFKDIVFISAKEAINGILNKDEQLINQSNIKELNYSIEKNFKEICEEVQINSKYSNLQMMKNNILNEIYIYKREMYKDISKYNEVKHELRLQLDNTMYEVNKILDNLVKGDYKSLESLKMHIKEIEKILSKDLEKTYENLSIIATFNRFKEAKYIDTDFHFMRSKHLVPEYNEKIDLIKFKNKKGSYIEEILSIINKNKLKNTNEDIKLSKDVLNKKIELLRIEILQQMKDKIDIIEFAINNILEESFKSEYVSYKDVKEYIKYLNNIENILIKLGE